MDFSIKLLRPQWPHSLRVWISTLGCPPRKCLHPVHLFSLLPAALSEVSASSNHYTGDIFLCNLQHKDTGYNNYFKIRFANLHADYVNFSNVLSFVLFLYPQFSIRKSYQHVTVLVKCKGSKLILLNSFLHLVHCPRGSVMVTQIWDGKSFADLHDLGKVSL